MNADSRRWKEPDCVIPSASYRVHPRLLLDRSQTDFLERIRKLVDVGRGAEGPGTDADGAVGEGADGAVDVRGAVQARADGDVERLVQDAADLGGGERFAAEGEGADAARHVAMAEDFVAADVVEPAPETFDEV